MTKYSLQEARPMEPWSASSYYMPPSYANKIRVVYDAQRIDPDSDHVPTPWQVDAVTRTPEDGLVLGYTEAIFNFATWREAYDFALSWANTPEAWED